MGVGLSRPVSPRQARTAAGSGMGAAGPEAGGEGTGGHSSLRLRAGATRLAPLSPLDVLDRALGGGPAGGTGGGGGLAALLDQLVDLVSWVDFTSSEDVNSGWSV